MPNLGLALGGSEKSRDADRRGDRKANPEPWTMRDVKRTRTTHSTALLAKSIARRSPARRSVYLRWQEPVLGKSKTVSALPGVSRESGRS